MPLLSKNKTHKHPTHGKRKEGTPLKPKKGDNILKVRDLDIERGGRKVLSSIDVDVEFGEILAILGPNGSGKTSFLRAVLGILPSSGEISWFEGLDINYLPEDLSPEKFREVPMTIGEFFDFKDVSNEQVVETLDSVGMDPKRFLDRNPGELSGGQFQRLLIAWSLVDRPDVLLFDEPTTSIDVGGEETIYSLLKEFWEDNDMTVLLVTHEVDVVYGLANNVLCLREKKICHGAPREALTPETLKKLYGSPVNLHKHKSGE